MNCLKSNVSLLKCAVLGKKSHFKLFCRSWVTSFRRPIILPNILLSEGEKVSSNDLQQILMTPFCPQRQSSI